MYLYQNYNMYVMKVQCILMNPLFFGQFCFISAMAIYSTVMIFSWAAKFYKVI